MVHNLAMEETSLLKGDTCNIHTHTHTHACTHKCTHTHIHTPSVLSIFINTHCTYKITWGISCCSQRVCIYGF